MPWGDAELESIAVEPKQTFCYVGAPAIFRLERACKALNRAFGCYGVGSAWQRPNWRDVDVRFIMKDDAFKTLFPKARVDGHAANWEFDDRWLLLTTAISAQLSAETGLPIDFQFQPASFANARHHKQRHPLGLQFVERDDDD